MVRERERKFEMKLGNGGDYCFMEKRERERCRGGGGQPWWGPPTFSFKIYIYFFNK